MTPELLEFLCDPIDQAALTLVKPSYDAEGRIVSGELVSASGRTYSIKNGIPRFVVNDMALSASVESFGNEWNHFNFDEFKQNWLNHTVKNTFGSLAAFQGKLVVDCGAGSGMQTKWIAEAGAKHVIALELSHSVDDVMQRNLNGMSNVDIVQCSIDQPPIRPGAIDGIVICHNVIQHTPSVERTAQALWKLVGKGGEFVFNCYPKNDVGLVRKIRFQVYSGLRWVLSRCSFSVILAYSRLMAVLRLVPLLGFVLEKGAFMVRGDVPPGPQWISRAYKLGVLNTFDCFGSHQYQHLKTDQELQQLVNELQPKPEYVQNRDGYFLKPPPIGIALRLFKDS